MQGNDYVQSVMYRHSVTCFDCHDAHGTGNYADCANHLECCVSNVTARNRRMARAKATLTEHTPSQRRLEGSECIACHMPKIETTLGTTKVRAHTFAFISPAETEKYAIPNPCTECHKDKTNPVGQDALRGWPARSPWRVERNQRRRNVDR